MKLFSWLLIISVFVIFVGIALWTLSSGTKDSNKVLSPDGKYSVQVVGIDGGATTGHTTVVSIVNEKSFFKNFDFLNIWMGDKTGAFAISGVKSSVKIVWVNNRTLKITYVDCKKIEDKNKSWKDIKIIYEGQCSENK